jgi:hypothetical protein
MRLYRPLHPPPPRPLRAISLGDLAWFAVGFVIATIVLAWIGAMP